MADSTFCWGVVLPVAVHTVAHIQDTHLAYLFHAPYIAVAGETLKTSADVGFMYKSHMVRHSVDPDPVDDVFIDPGILHLSDGRGGYARLLAHHLMTEHTLLNSGHCGCGPLVDVAVAEGALELIVLDVGDMAEGDGLRGTCAGYNLGLDKQSSNYE